jgi:putative ABC transport system substrate-binding protein
MRRREFISLFGAAAVWPFGTRAQQPHQMRRIGILMGGFDESDHDAQSRVAAFREELEKLGWTEGRNVEIDTRWAKADVESMEQSAREVSRFNPTSFLRPAHPLLG